MTGSREAWKEKPYLTSISSSYSNAVIAKIFPLPYCFHLSSLIMNRYFTLAFFILLLASSGTYAQRPSKPAVGCIDKSIRLQADDIKQHYMKQGFVVYRDAMLNMESMTPSPVMVEMKAGEMYQIIFVGPLDIARMNLNLFDGQDNQILERFIYTNRKQPNYILVNFIPERTDTYLLTLMQKLKNKEICGSLCILRMSSEKRDATVTPYAE